ncbi:PREDICTED: aspartyl protease family protein At5g10770-like [Ipomoea nil]|uniref:aspartyl protease family protein At5g10770-like n=1 Tax=Ipomoea nil TaxID=35883 RepID=UPI0009008CBE|nr:PREDICTED: aspartyl protease family protein At5g10770-like [Ipomoea nil]
MLKLLLQSFSANVFLLVIMISCSLEKGNASRRLVGDLEAHHHQYQTLPLSSMLPPFDCDQTTSKGDSGPDRKVSMKVVHKFGPCSARAQNSATMTEILLRDRSRVQSLQARRHRSFSLIGESSETVHLPAVSESGNFFVTVGLGTPAKDVELELDTGSDFTWTQCQPCAAACYNQSLPIFDPAASTTYSNVKCASQACSDLEATTYYPSQCEDSAVCHYTTSYFDESFSRGELATDKLTLTSTHVVDGFVFGCGHNNSLVGGGDSAGVLGLGTAPLSIVSQTSQKFGSYFSYCLPTPTGSGGHLTFGKNNKTPNNLNYTPFLKSSDKLGFYYIEILSISINRQKLPISPAVFRDPGMIIDSGTTLTYLPMEAYNALRDAFKKQMTMYPMVPSSWDYDPCYNFTDYPNPVIPTISFEFGGDLVVDLDPRGVMIAQDDAAEVCLAFLGNKNDNEAGVLGNYQQQTFDVVYDVAGGRLGFAPGGCS